MAHHGSQKGLENDPNRLWDVRRCLRSDARGKKKQRRGEVGDRFFNVKRNLPRLGRRSKKHRVSSSPKLGSLRVYEKGGSGVRKKGGKSESFSRGAQSKKKKESGSRQPSARKRKITGKGSITSKKSTLRGGGVRGTKRGCLIPLGRNR